MTWTNPEWEAQGSLVRQGSTWHPTPASDLQPRNPGWGWTMTRGSYRGPSLLFLGMWLPFHPQMPTYSVMAQGLG